MHKIARKDIIIESRQRRVADQKDLRDKFLRQSIQAKGLMHPIVLALHNFEDPLTGRTPIYRLIAGGRRLANIDWIAEDKEYFVCNTETILPGEVPAILLTELNVADLLEAELEENIQRVDLPWQDRIEAINAIHKLRLEANPKQTVSATAREIQKMAPGLGDAKIRREITEAQVIAKHLNDPAINKARNANEAFAIAVRKEEATYRAALIEKRQAIPSTVQLFEGDCCVILPTLPAGTIDLIIADPPYGISAGSAGFRSRTIHHHNYADTEDVSKSIVQTIFTDGFRLSKARANIFLFCDINLWQWIGDTAERAGWTPFRTPIIWAKSDSEGLAPWGSQGFRRTYELIFFATKGQRGLISSPVDILRHSRVLKSERDYGAAKPVALIRELIEISTLPGDTILDPCCGSGATIVAANESNRAVIGIELDKNAFNLTKAKIGDPNAASPPPDSAPNVADL